MAFSLSAIYVGVFFIKFTDTDLEFLFQARLFPSSKPPLNVRSPHPIKYIHPYISLNVFQTWSPLSNLAWRLSSAVTGRSFKLLSHQPDHQNSVVDMIARGPATILEEPSTSRLANANVDPRSIFHNWQNVL